MHDKLNNPLKLRILLNDNPVQLDYQTARMTLWALIPDWLKSSTIDPPEPETDQQTNIAPGLLKVVRSGMKNLARPFLPQLYKALYGQDLHLGRNDSMPVLVQLLVDFIVLQALQHPLEVKTDGEGNIQEVRQVKRDR